MADVSKIAANGIEYDIKDETARAELTTAQTDIDSLESGLASAENDISAIQSDVSTAQSDITTLRSDVATAQNDITALQTQVNGLITGASGYCKMADGTMIQWGTFSGFTLSNGVLYGSVAMPYSFANTSYCVMLTPARNCIAYMTAPICEGNNGGNITRTVNSFAIVSKGTNANVSINWLAIGRWK